MENLTQLEREFIDMLRRLTDQQHNDLLRMLFVMLRSKV